LPGLVLTGPASGLMWIKVPIPQPAEIHLNCGRTTMNKPAVLDNTNEETCRSAIRTGKLVVNLDTRIGSVDDRAVHQYNLLERT
jgi:hypothetical protein